MKRYVDPYLVACPTCKAPPDHCCRVRGRECGDDERAEPHARRVAAARDQNPQESDAALEP